MIIETLLGAVVGLLRGLLTLLPQVSWDLPPVTSVFQTMGFTIGLVDSYFPVRTLVTCLTVYFAVRVFISSWHVVIWIYDKFPFKAT